jgi:hypothetical protein
VRVLVTGLTPGELCGCTLQNELYLSAQEYNCGTRTRVDCYFAVILTWLAAMLVSFVLIYFCWAVVMLAIGVLRGIIIGVGSVQSWQDVTWALVRLKGTSMNVITAARPFKSDEQAQTIPELASVDPESIRNAMASINQRADKSIWSWFIESLFDDFLITGEEKKMLQSDAAFPPRNDEAKRRIVHFLWSLDHMTNIDASQSFYRQSHRVRTMPSWSVIVPIYNEPIVYSAAELRTRERPDSHAKRVSLIEYLIDTYNDEWCNFVEYVLAENDEHMLGLSPTPEELLQLFLDELLNDWLETKIRIWASLRGQTLLRTMKGLDNYRRALEILERKEEGSWDCVLQLASRKLQIIVAHQTYHPQDRFSDPIRIEQQMRITNDFDLVMDVCAEFDVVYDDREIPGQSTFCSHMMRFSDRHHGDAYITHYQLNRPGPLIMGEGKAENQARALFFAMNEILQCIDMNQYNTLENGFKVPFFLADQFGTDEALFDLSRIYTSDKIVPRFRIVGFPEHTYTRGLSMVGELMGAAEFAFVTIHQRILADPLCVRAHYGHPDFVDGIATKSSQVKSSQAKPSQAKPSQFID